MLNLAEMTRGIHTDAMTLDSKIFVDLRSARKKSASASEPTGPKCQWDGCEKVGTHRAPVGPGAEGLYLLFCLEHVKEYNKGYSYTTVPSNADVARYQREATAGSRPTRGTRVNQPTEIPIPSTVRSGSAKALNARKTAAQRQAQKADLQKRKLKVLEAILAIGPPTGSKTAELNTIVEKFGRTTGYTRGYVESISTDIKVPYEIGSILFHDQIAIKSIDALPFSDQGDSGALVLEQTTGSAIGLLFAGSATVSFANHITDVLDAFGVDLVSG